ncbi:hypothetical protein WD019_08045 [Fictibacillus sp. Mic-4]|uniref:hypothetical protein n=1 Tax=Fictibacillus TaxID=1329200 RepID=UPI000478F8E3|nr:hypothetical protein [Fictibacillus gelatini]
MGVITGITMIFTVLVGLRMFIESARIFLDSKKKKHCVHRFFKLLPLYIVSFIIHTALCWFFKENEFAQFALYQLPMIFLMFILAWLLLLLAAFLNKGKRQAEKQTTTNRSRKIKTTS